jgi:hypothetical protein
MTDDPNDRFGMPEEAFEAARRSHGQDNPFVRLGMYVPTRHEVATMEPKTLLVVLDFWIWESPTELIPRREQVVEVRRILRDRPDIDDPAVQDIIGLVDRYLAGRSG